MGIIEVATVNNYHQDYSRPEFTGTDQVATTLLPPLLRDEVFDMQCNIGATIMPSDAPYNPVGEQAEDYRRRGDALRYQRSRIEEGTFAARFLLCNQVLLSIGSSAPELNIKTDNERIEAFIGTLTRLQADVTSGKYQVGIIPPATSVTEMTIGDHTIDYRTRRPLRLTQPTARGQLEIYNTSYPSGEREVARAVKGFNTVWEQSLTQPDRVGIIIGKKISLLSSKL